MQYSDDLLKRILTQTRSIACVGVSSNPIRPSNYVYRYLHHKGFRMIPVNPGQAGKTLYGRVIHADIASIPASEDPIDMVEIFRRPEHVPSIVEAALDHLLHRGLKTIWMQFGIIHQEAAEKARAAGLTVIMDRCPKLENQRLFGELRMAGFNTGIISSKL